MNQVQRRVIGWIGAVVTISAGMASLAGGCGGDIIYRYVPDASVSDSGPDTSVTDSGPDVTGDALADVSDAGSDATDATSTAIGINDFSLAFAQSYCNYLVKCCFASNPPKPFNSTQCQTDWQNFGQYDNIFQDQHLQKLRVHNTNVSQYFDAGSIIYQADAASECITLMNNLPCGSVTAQSQIDINSVCLSVVTGTKPASTPCLGTVQCQPGTFCNFADAGVDGSVGLCTNLIPIGGACVSTDNCLYRGIGSLGNPYCTGQNSGGGLCQAPQSVGSSCIFDQECSSGLCNYSGVCDTTSLIVTANDPNYCTPYLILDAGGGG